MKKEIFCKLNNDDKIKALSQALWYACKEIASNEKQDAHKIYNYFKNVGMMFIEETECRNLESEIKEKGVENGNN